MPDIINSSFDPRLPFPLDVRQQVQDMNALYAIPNTSRWEGMMVYVKGAQIPYILKGGIDNSFWVPFQFNGGGGILPNGIVVYGEAQQSGNDILLNDAWVWRIDQVDYQSSDDTIAITPAASGNLRVDIIVGDALGDFVKVVGTEVASPGPAIEPNIPADTVPLLRVEVNDTGITAFEEFALSAFVRFDIDNQGLTPTFRQNARTNIQALARDVADTHTGQLTQEGKLIIDLDEVSGALGIVEIYQQGVLKHRFSGEEARIIPHLLRVNTPIAPTARGASFRGSTDGGDPIFEIQNAGGLKIFYPRGTGGIGQLRSNASDTSIRRDENFLTFPTTISGTGKLNDVALADGVGEIKFGAGVTEVSGIDANGDTKELLIWSDNPDGITLPAEDALSIAANRFHRDVNIPYQTWVKIVYDGDLARWVNGNTGELQETDARYFEVTSDVLTLKYILPDIAALQAFVRGPAVIAEVSDPLRGGKFNYVTEAEFPGTADNGISFLAQDGGYWVRDFEGDINLLWYNLKGDGSTDNTALFNSAKTANPERLLVFPKGTFKGNFVIDNGIRIKGEGIRETIFIAQNNANPILTFAESSFAQTLYLDSGGFSVDGLSKTATLGIRYGAPDQTAEANYLNHQNIEVRNCIRNIEMNRVIGFNFQNIYSYGAEEDALYIPVNDIVTAGNFITCRFRQSKTNLNLRGGALIKFTACVIESALDTGMYILKETTSGARQIKFESCWFENNGYSPTTSTSGGIFINISPSMVTAGGGSDLVFNQCLITSATGQPDLRLNRGSNIEFNQCSFKSYDSSNLVITTGTGYVYAKFNNCGTFDQTPNPTMYANFPERVLSVGKYLGIAYEYQYQGQTYRNYTGKIARPSANLSDYDVTGVTVLAIDTSSGDVSILSLSGGYDGQEIDIIKTSSLNNIIIPHNTAGTQRIYTPDSGTKTLSTRSGARLVCENNVWYFTQPLTLLGTSSQQVSGTATNVAATPSGVNNLINKNGITAERPSLAPLRIGTRYFDTTLGKPIYKKDDTTWVDATGTAV